MQVRKPERAHQRHARRAGEESAGAEAYRGLLAVHRHMAEAVVLIEMPDHRRDPVVRQARHQVGVRVVQNIRDRARHRFRSRVRLAKDLSIARLSRMPAGVIVTSPARGPQPCASHGSHSPAPCRPVRAMNWSGRTRIIRVSYVASGRRRKCRAPPSAAPWLPPRPACEKAFTAGIIGIECQEREARAQLLEHIPPRRKLLRRDECPLRALNRCSPWAVDFPPGGPNTTGEPS